MTAPARVVVVGGGIVGSAIAFHLALRRVGEVILVDAGYPAASTRRSAAVVRAACADPVLGRLARISLRQFAAWPELVGGGCDFRATGAVIVADAADALRFAAEVRAAPLSAPDLARRLPWYHVTPGASAYLDPRGGTVDALKTRASLQAAARRLGVSIHRGLRVDRLLTAHGTVRGVSTARGDLPADLVILAAGPWTPHLLAGAGARLPLRTILTELVVIRAPGLRPSLPLIDLAAGILIRPYRASYLLVGSRAALPAEPAEGAPQPQLTRTLLAQLAQAAPALAGGRLRAAWSGYYDMSPDGRPLLGRLPSTAGLLLAAGLSGGGVKLAPAIGFLIARLVATGRGSALLTACAPERQASPPAEPLPIGIPEWTRTLQPIST